ncbi:atrial natriuretic peptide receptor 1-like isoform X4 [Vespula squamosa]|uniref:Atrial natriuretic peptide receptor 1-like isoform X4 n=1 Tax=Vespula squamosa TaxID=30214 RepID=A0ABD2BXZ4_VESSQ
MKGITLDSTIHSNSFFGKKSNFVNRIYEKFFKTQCACALIVIRTDVGADTIVMKFVATVENEQVYSTTENDKQNENDSTK